MYFGSFNPDKDPLKLFEKYGKRFELMHLKDMKRGTPSNFTGGSDVTNDVPLGAGVIDLKNVLKAAKKASVKWYFLEDESPSVITQVPTSLRYLQEMKF